MLSLNICEGRIVPSGVSVGTAAEDAEGSGEQARAAGPIPSSWPVPVSMAHYLHSPVKDTWPQHHKSPSVYQVAEGGPHQTLEPLELGPWTSSF